jgi:hypothetical protein
MLTDSNQSNYKQRALIGGQDHSSPHTYNKISHDMMIWPFGHKIQKERGGKCKCKKFMILVDWLEWDLLLSFDSILSFLFEGQKFYQTFVNKYHQIIIIR